jgi:hypothetical protein
MKKAPNILLINPWIYDFAAHDLWSKPLGLLMLAGLLRAQGCQLRLLDCLDIYDPRLQEVEGMRPATRRGFGTGKFFRQQVAKPAVLEGFDRSYYRFGTTPEMFQERLLEGVRPDAWSKSTFLMCPSSWVVSTPPSAGSTLSAIVVPTMYSPGPVRLE